MRISGWSSDVCSSDLPAQSSEWAGATDDIVVTGQRRVSTVQNTAAAISVLTADVLVASGTDSSMGLQFATPGLVVSQDHGLQTQIYIRGIGSNLQGIATEIGRASCRERRCQ